MPVSATVPVLPSVGICTNSDMKLITIRDSAGYMHVVNVSSIVEFTTDENSSEDNRCGYIELCNGRRIHVYDKVIKAVIDELKRRE